MEKALTRSEILVAVLICVFLILAAQAIAVGVSNRRFEKLFSQAEAERYCLVALLLLGPERREQLTRGQVDELCPDPAVYEARRLDRMTSTTVKAPDPSEAPSGSTGEVRKGTRKGKDPTPTTLRRRVPSRFRRPLITSPRPPSTTTTSTTTTTTQPTCETVPIVGCGL